MENADIAKVCLFPPHHTYGGGVRRPETVVVYAALRPPAMSMIATNPRYTTVKKLQQTDPPYDFIQNLSYTTTVPYPSKRILPA
jgi:hypothetical protein